MGRGIAILSLTDTDGASLDFVELASAPQVCDKLHHVFLEKRGAKAMGRSCLAAIHPSKLSVGDWGLCMTLSSDDPLQPGSPVFDLDGAVVGMCLDPSAVLMITPTLVFQITELIGGRKLESKVIDAVFSPSLSKELLQQCAREKLQGGVLVQASKSEGLKTGDLIVQLDGQEVSSPEQLSLIVQEKEEVELEVVRPSESGYARIKVKERTVQKRTSRICVEGLTFKVVDIPYLVSQDKISKAIGLKLLHVAPESPFVDELTQGHLAEGDIIWSINNLQIEDPEAAEKMIRSAVTDSRYMKKDSVFQINRDVRGKRTIVTVGLCPK